MHHFALICSLILFSPIGLATPSWELQSRNMPTHCEFVYQVFSEIQVSWSAELASDQLEFRLYHEYDEFWEPAEIREGTCDEVRCQASIALESMSTASHFLYRRIRFRSLDTWSNPTSEWHQATFGREFGERCYTNPADTPFRVRQVENVANPSRSESNH